MSWWAILIPLVQEVSCPILIPDPGHGGIDLDRVVADLAAMVARSTIHTPTSVIMCLTSKCLAINYDERDGFCEFAKFYSKTLLCIAATGESVDWVDKNLSWIGFVISGVWLKLTDILSLKTEPTCPFIRTEPEQVWNYCCQWWQSSPHQWQCYDVLKPQPHLIIALTAPPTTGKTKTMFLLPPSLYFRLIVRWPCQGTIIVNHTKVYTWAWNSNEFILPPSGWCEQYIISEEGKLLAYNCQ